VAPHGGNSGLPHPERCGPLKTQYPLKGYPGECQETHSRKITKLKVLCDAALPWGLPTNGKRGRRHINAEFSCLRYEVPRSAAPPAERARTLGSGGAGPGKRPS